MAKLTKAKLKEMAIYNPHNLASRGIEPKLFVDYSPQQTGRASQSAKWVVVGVGFDTDPKAAWYDHKCKVFYPDIRKPLDKANKDAARDDALAWASEKYGVKEWERSPFGSYHPKGTLAALEAT